MNKLLFYLLICCCCWQTVIGQDTPVQDSIVNESYTDDYSSDTAVIIDEQSESEEEEQGFQKPTIRIVSADSVKKILRQDGFGYMRYIDSFYRNNKPKAEIKKQEKEVQPSKSIFDITGIRVLYWGLALTAVLFLLYKLFAGNSALFSRNKRLQAAPEETQEIPLTTDHLTQMLEKAIREKNYRLATRLMYLQTISLLGEKQLLNISPQKTNYQYVQELRGTALQQPFSKLTMQYEYAWFGGFEINNDQFNAIRKGYDQFKSQI